MNNNQLTESGQLRHFLTIEGLKKPLLTEIMDRAEQFSGITNRQVKKVPILRGKTIVNLFFENSTRTRSTFELAAKRLSADVMNFNISTSATSKGESLLDTLHNLESMHTDMFVVRHNQSGAAESMPVMVVMPIPHRPCLICLPFVATKKASQICG